MVWNPSEGIDLGFFMIRYYSLMFVIAFGLGWYIMKKIFLNEKESLEKLDTLFVWTVLATLLGARLGHVFFYDWEYFRNHLLEILLPFKFEPEFKFTGFAGLASHGAAISIIIVMYFYSKNIIKRPILWVLDRVVISVACGAIFVRIGNFFNSEIVGKVTNNAKVASYKDIQVEISYFSKTGAFLMSTTDVVYDVVKPGKSASFKNKEFAPKGTDSVAVKVVDAKIE